MALITAAIAAVSGMCLIGSASAFVHFVPPSTGTGMTYSTKKNIITPVQQQQQPRSTREVTVSMTTAAGVESAAAGGDGASLPRVLCHGEILFDCIANPEAAGWALEKVEESAAWKAYPGGAPANVACALAKLGVPATFVGAVGRDEEGTELLQVLQDSGVGTELATTIDDYPTRTVMVTRDADGDRTFAGFGGGQASDSFADCQHRLGDTEDAAREMLKPGAWVVQGTLGLAYTDSFESHVRLAEWAKEAGAVRYLDINWRPVFWELATGNGGGGVEEQGAYSYESLARERITDFAVTADVVKLTDEEAEWLCGVSGETALRDPSCLHSYFPSAKAILVTAGEKGAAYTIGGQTGFIPVFESVKVVETTGAGDAFSAGFISEAIKFLSTKNDDDDDVGTSSSSGLDAIGVAAGGGAGEVKGGAARDMVRFASAVGALTCCGDGAIKPQPLRGDVLGLLAAEGGPSSASAAPAAATA